MLGITAYAVLGSADFGAGFWDLTAGGAERGGRVRGMIAALDEPGVGGQPRVADLRAGDRVDGVPGRVRLDLLDAVVPLFLAALGIIFRGAAFALRGQAATISEARVLGALFALSSVLIPFCLGAALGGVASGRVPVGNAAGDPCSSWLNPTSVLIGVLAVLTGAYLAAVFLAGDSQRAGQPDLVARVPRPRAGRRRAHRASSRSAALFVLRDDAPDLYDGLTSGGGLVW